LRFDLIPLRLDFKARDTLHFPAGKSANILRGAFGMALKRVAPAADYARIFEPRGHGSPSGLADPPRPFVFRSRHLDSRSVRPREEFHFHLNLFTQEPALRDLIVQAFDDAAREGFGPGRGKAELRNASGEVVSLDLSPRPAVPASVRVDFLSPTELKHEQRIVDRPDFPILFARVRDRVGALRVLYGAGPLDIDFAGMGARAQAVRMSRCDLRPVDVDRRSSRTGQNHSIGGFIGQVEYEGALAEFLPYLEAAHWTGVGRQAVWGKGEILVVTNSAIIPQLMA
jgi:hypothetical protein